jgi:hypothetical protein
MASEMMMLVLMTVAVMLAAMKMVLLRMRDGKKEALSFIPQQLWPHSPPRHFLVHLAGGVQSGDGAVVAGGSWWL